MTTTKAAEECNSCGYGFDTPSKVGSPKTPCPNCGSTLRCYTAAYIEKAMLCDGYEAKGKRPGKKKFTFEEMHKPDYSIRLAKYVRKRRLIDRDNNRYMEEITDYQTNEIIHHCDEPLTEHFGHGSAKFKNK